MDHSLAGNNCQDIQYMLDMGCTDVREYRNVYSKRLRDTCRRCSSLPLGWRPETHGKELQSDAKNDHSNLLLSGVYAGVILH